MKKEEEKKGKKGKETIFNLLKELSSHLNYQYSNIPKNCI